MTKAVSFWKRLSGDLGRGGGGHKCGYSETSERKGPMSVKRSGYGGQRARTVSSYGIHAVIEEMSPNNACT